MKKSLRNLFLVASITVLAFSANAQKVLLDAHSKAGGLTTWQITTTHPNELIIIGYDGYGSGPLDISAGAVKVNGNNATYITKGEWYNSQIWVSSVWAYEAPTVGTYTMTCTETGLSSPWYFNYASSVYDPNAILHVFDILIGGHDSNQSMDTVKASITTTVNNAWVYGGTCWNDNGGSGTLNWQGGLTELDHDYISNGVDGAQADSTMAVAGLKKITVTDVGASGAWSSIVLVAVQPPTCALSISIDSIIGPSCHDSIWAVVSGGSGHYKYLWSPGGATTSAIGHLCLGTYKVMVTDSIGCFDSATIVLTHPAGINNINGQENGINFYPNPFKQSFTVDVNTNEPVVVTMFNMLGENVGSWTLNNGLHSIDAQQFPSGIYMMQAKTLNGTLLSSKKIVKLAQ